MKTFWNMLTVVMVLLIIVVGAGGIIVTVVNNAAGTLVLPPCTTEDSVEDCYWDGGENGEGRHFIVLDGTVYYPE